MLVAGTEDAPRQPATLIMAASPDASAHRDVQPGAFSRREAEGSPPVPSPRAGGPDVTALLSAWREGDASARERLVALLYGDLRQLAHRRLRWERGDHTLNTTALVHEAYLRLSDVDQIAWQGRAHFLAMAARTMRRVLIDYAHRRRAAKRGGGAPHVPFDERLHVPDTYLEALLDLDEALTRLAEEHARAAYALEQRYFGGLSLEETAEALGVSLATAKRDLRFAQAWLARELGDEP
jgi:RNA polymerase sigma factor (TIGR02999 family)